MTAQSKDYRAAQSETGEWIIYGPDDSVYPICFGSNQAAAEDMANALNFPRQNKMMLATPTHFQLNEETGRYEGVIEVPE